MSKFQLKADVRDFSGKEKAKKLRAEGKLPAIVYGADAGPVSLTCSVHDVNRVLQRIRGEKVLLDLSYGDRQDLVFVRSVQREPVTEMLMHIDFYRVDPAHEIDTKVPIISTGTPLGVKEGGMLEHGVRQVEVRCLPTTVPPHIVVSVDHLEIGQSIHVSDLSPIEGVVFRSAADAVLFTVKGKAKSEAEELAEEAARLAAEEGTEEGAAEGAEEQPAAAK